MKKRRLLLLFIPFAVIGCQAAPRPVARAQIAMPTSAEQIARIETSSVEIAKVQSSKGNNGALEAIDACYRSVTALSVATAEVCATQDYVISKVSIAALSQFGAAGKANNSYKIALGAPKRIAELLSAKGMNREQQSNFMALVQTYGLPAFEKARF